MSFLEIISNILMYMLAIIAFLCIIFLVIVLPIVIIIYNTPKKKWYRITYKFDFMTYYYVIKAKNNQQAEIKFRTKSGFGNNPIVSIEEMKY
jgi:hypothetical protein